MLLQPLIYLPVQRRLSARTFLVRAVCRWCHLRPAALLLKSSDYRLDVLLSLSNCHTRLWVIAVKGGPYVSKGLPGAFVPVDNDGGSLCHAVYMNVTDDDDRGPHFEDPTGVADITVTYQNAAATCGSATERDTLNQPTSVRHSLSEVSIDAPIRDHRFRSDKCELCMTSAIATHHASLSPVTGTSYLRMCRHKRCH